MFSFYSLPNISHFMLLIRLYSVILSPSLTNYELHNTDGIIRHAINVQKLLRGIVHPLYVQMAMPLKLKYGG